MKLIPPEISRSTPSSAEKTLFRLLRLVDLDGCSALHSLNLSEHEYKRCGEIDFLVFGPPGILVLEVKGGRVARKEGIWTFTDRYGNKRRKAEGPFEQAQSAAFALLDRVRELTPAGALPRFVLGWGAVFPDQEFKERSVEWAPEMVIDERCCRTAASLEAALRRLMRYSSERSERTRRLRPEEVDLLQRTLRPDFDLVPSVRVLGEQLDLVGESLTETQYKVLDLVEQNERILCAGGAGTGKTFLAAEIARRELSAGRRVLITCRSPIMARFLSQQAMLATEGCVVAELSSAATVPAPFDCVVVDEAQDLMNLDDLVAIDRLLIGGLNGGRWRMFYDSNNQTGILGNFDPAVLELLNECGPTRIHLSDNCRNTRDIVGQVQLVTGADIGVSAAGAGVPVEYRFWTNRQEAVDQLAAHLSELLDDGVEPRHITILSPGPFEDSCVKALPDRIRAMLVPLDSNSVIRTVNGIGFASIRDFKGLENRFVCVVDVSEIDESRKALNTLYVAMTRARAGLWLGIPEVLRTRLAASERGQERQSSLDRKDA